MSGHRQSSRRKHTRAVGGGAEVDAETLARRFHETYERLAPAFGYTTRPETAVAWDQVPERSRQLMIAVCQELLGYLRIELTVPNPDTGK